MKCLPMLLGGAAACALAFGDAGAQSNPGLVQGQVPTPAQWNSYFSAKVDYPLPLATCGAISWTVGVGITCNTALGNLSGGTLTVGSIISTGIAQIGGASATATWLALGVNGTTRSQINLGTPGTLATTSVAGDIESEGKSLYYSAVAGNRGSIPAVQSCSLSSPYTLSNGTAAQKAFNCSTNGQITLASNTAYQFEADYLGTNTGTASHTWQTLFAGGASLSSITYDVVATSSGTASTPTAALQLWQNVATATSVTTASTSATENVTIKLRGMVRVTTGGTFIPQIRFSGAVAGTATMTTGSYFRIWSIGPDTVTVNGNWN